MKEVYAFPYIEDVPSVVEGNVQFITDLKFQSDNLSENVHDVSLEDKSSVKDDKTFDLFGIFKEEQPTLDMCIDSNSTIKFV